MLVRRRAFHKPIIPVPNHKDKRRGSLKRHLRNLPKGNSTIWVQVTCIPLRLLRQTAPSAQTVPEVRLSSAVPDPRIRHITPRDLRVRHHLVEAIVLRRDRNPRAQRKASERNRKARALNQNLLVWG